MENIKKNPVLMGILAAVGTAALLLALEFVLSLVKGASYAEQLNDPVTIIILIAGPIFSGISSYLKAKKNTGEKK